MVIKISGSTFEADTDTELGELVSEKFGLTFLQGMKLVEGALSSSKPGPKPKGTMRGLFRPIEADVKLLEQNGVDYRKVAAAAVHEAAQKIRTGV